MSEPVGSEDQSSFLELVLLPIFLSFTLILSYMVSQQQDKDAELERRIKKMGGKIKDIAGTTAGEIALKEVEVQKALQRAKLENAWLQFRVQRPMFALLQRIPTAAFIALERGENGSHLPKQGSYGDLRRGIDQLYRVNAGPNDVVDNEVWLLVAECLRRAKMKPPDAVWARRVGRAAGPEAQAFAFEPDVATQENIESLEKVIREDLRGERKQIERLQLELVIKIAAARIADGADSGGDDNAVLALHELVGELSRELSLLPEVEHLLLAAIPEKVRRGE
jgi:hypothetical protein